MNKKTPPEKKPTPEPGRTWPGLLRISPRTFLFVVGGWLALAWCLFLLVDILQIVDFGFNRPMWRLLFNDRPVEWTQWILLGIAAGSAGYLSGRLDAAGERRAGRFFLLLAIGFGLMLVEDAGDIRHVATSEIGRVLDGSRILGMPYRFVFELPYFAALAAIPVYAVIRYGREAWRAVSARRFLVGGVIFYALASFGSAMSNIGNLYGVIGSWVDRFIFSGRFPPAPGQSEGWAHFYLVDSLLEESIELLGLILLITAILAFTRDFRQRRLEPPAESGPEKTT